MIYVLAAIGAITVIVLMWRAFGPENGLRDVTGRPGPVAPDDDPDFLRKLDEQGKHRNNGDAGES